MAYLNVEAIEDYIISLAERYSSLCKVIELRNKSREGRTIHALIIGKNKDDKTNDSIFFTGGVHAREWGGSDICVYFAADILEAYSKGTGLRYGNQYFDATQIKKIVDELNIIILPDVNPDGKKFSQSDPRNSLWRGNRKLDGNPECFGVDLNRNYDLLWDFRRFFSPEANVHTSDDPCDDMQLYKGSHSFSEPETRNVKTIFDEYDGIRNYVDIHCALGTIFYCWGIDQNQTVKPEMNFKNSNHNNIRGIEDDDQYREYISPKDYEYVKHLATSFSNALKKVRGTEYRVEQSFGLYATSGAGDDYAYGRHIMDQTKKKIFGFTVEFGRDRFQPPWEEMEKIIIEVCAGMIGFCFSARKNN